MPSALVMCEQLVAAAWSALAVGLTVALAVSLCSPDRPRS